MAENLSIWSHQWWLLFFVEVGVDWVMQLLLILFIIVIAIFIERLVYFAVRHGNPHLLEDLLYKEFLGPPQNKESATLNKLLIARWSIPAGIIREVLPAILENRIDMARQLIAARIRREKLLLERGLAFLGTVGNNAPFIGLFGTVLGIIRSFRDLSDNITSGSAAVMAGIAEALVATAIGLMVALPAVIAYNLLQRQVRGIIQRTENVCDVLIASKELIPSDFTIQEPPSSEGEENGESK